jgi:hypothetical protein
MLMQTYELYLEDRTGNRWFEPMLCKLDTELVPRARAMLAERDLMSVEVREAGRTLFTVAR